MINKKTYTISEVAQILGVSTKTLRRWEKKGSISPIRTLGNQRRYTEMDIAILRQKAKKNTPYLPEPTQKINPFTKEDLKAKMGVSSDTVNRWEKDGKIDDLNKSLKQSPETNLPIIVPTHYSKSEVKQTPHKPTSKLSTKKPSNAPSLQSTDYNLPSKRITAKKAKKDNYQRYIWPTVTITSVAIIFVLLFARLLNPSSITEQKSKAALIDTNTTTAKTSNPRSDVGYFLGGKITVGSDEGSLSSLDADGNLSLESGSASISQDISIGGSINLIPHSEPTSPQIGSLYVDQSTQNLRFYNGSEWIDLDQETSDDIKNSLQSAYDSGSSITTDSNNISFNLTDTVGADADFQVNIKGDTSKASFSGPAGENLLTINPNASYPITISQPTQITGNLLAPKILDSNDTTYYIDLNSNDTAINVNGAIHTNGSIVFEPSQNTLSIKDSNYITFSKGLSVGDDTTYYFNQDGDINANNGLFKAGITTDNFTANGEIYLGNGDETVTISADTITFDDANLTTSLTLTSADTSIDSGDTAIIDAINTAYNTALGGGSWTITSGIIHPTTITNDLAIGGTTSTAPFFVDAATGNTTMDGDTALGDTAADTITFNAVAGSTLDMNGNLITNIGDAATDFTSSGGLNIAGTLDPTNVAAFTLTGDITGSTTPNLTGLGGITGTAISDGTATLASGTLDLGTNTIADGAFSGNWAFGGGNVSGVQNLTVAGTTTLNGATYTWPGADGTNGYVLSTNGSGTLAWIANGSGGSGGLWSIGSGAIFPATNTLDLLLGGNATASAKFAILNMSTGTPTASISGTTTDVATYLTGEGTLATTNKAPLTLGNSSTGNLRFFNATNYIDSTGNLTISNNITAAGIISGGSFTDGTTTISSGNFTGVNNFTSSGTITLSGLAGDTDDTILILNGSNVVGTRDIDTRVWGSSLVDGSGTTGLLASWSDADTLTTTDPATWDMNVWNDITTTNMATQAASILSGWDQDSSDDLGYSLTSGYLPYADSTSSLTDSPLFFDGTNIGFGDATPEHLLDIEGLYGGNALFSLNETGGNDIFTASSSGTSRFTIAANGNFNTDQQTIDWTLNDAVDALNFDSDTLSIDASNNRVGIGTGAPATGLHVVGTIRTDDTTYGIATYKVSSGYFNSNADLTLVAGSSAGDIILTPGSTGGIGIGTTSPDSKLHLTGAVIGKALSIFNETGDQSIFTASASGTTRFTIANDGTTSTGDLSLGLNNTSALLTTEDTDEDLTIDPNGTGNIYLQGSIYYINDTGDFNLGGRLTFENGEYFQNEADDFFVFAGTGGTADVDLTLDLDGTGPVLTSASSDTIYVNEEFQVLNNFNVFSGDIQTGSPGVTRITNAGNLTNIGTTGFNGVTYTWPGADGSSGYALTTNGSGTLSWSEALTAASVLWDSTNGTIYPKNSTLDLFVGGTSSASANFAFLNNSTGTPTASISGTTANVATYLTGEGLLATTNMTPLTIGNSTTGAISLSPAGSTGLFVDQSGNVGIGTTTPSEKLEVAGNIIPSANNTYTIGKLGLNYSDVRTLKVTGNSAYLDLSAGTYDWTELTSFQGMTFQIRDGYNFNFRDSDGSELVTIEETGNVGIGTTSPTALLDVAGNASASGNLALTGTTPKLNILNGDNFGIQTSVGGDVGLSEVFTITNDGKVGIGTTSPGSPLEIKYSSANTSTTTPALTLNNPTGASQTVQYFENNDVKSASLRADNSGNFVISASGGDLYLGSDGTQNNVHTYAGGTEKLTLLSAGNLGIGDTSPTALLTVGNGDLFQIDSTGSIINIDGVAHTIADTTGDLEITSNSTNISLNDNVTFAGTTTLNSVAYTWPGADGSADQVLATNGSGTLSWASVLTDGLSVGGWTHIDHALHPDEYWADDLIIGGNSTASATFQVTAAGNLTTENNTVDWTLNSAVDALNFDSDTLSIDASNNRVGIGTASPTQALTIQSGSVLIDSSGTGSYWVGANATSNYYKPHAGGSGRLNAQSNFTINIDANNALTDRFFAVAHNGIDGAGSELFRINESGNMGIGTTSPTALLDIAGNASASGNLALTGTTPKLNILNGDNFGIQTSVGGDTGLTERFTITNDGNVGIGTTSPSEKLTIAGGLEITSTTPQYFLMETDVSNSNWRFMGSGGTLYITEMNDNKTVNNHRLAIDTTGRIGIGDTSPTSLFTVGDGDLFQVDSTGSIISIDGVAHSIVDTSGDLELTSNSTNISLNDNVTFAGTTTLNSVTYTWPGADGSADQVLATDGSGTLSWASVLSDGLSVGGWTHIDHALHPDEYWADDLIIGGNSTASATFQVLASGDITTVNQTVDWTLNDGVDALNFDGDTLSIDALNNRVGIGTGAPEGKTHIYSGSAGSMTANTAADDLIIENTSAGASILGADANNNFLMFGTPSDNYGAGMYWNFDSDLYTIGTANTGGEIQFQSSNQSNAMKIDNSGNVGIGTTNPLSKLNVVGDIIATDYISAPGATLSASIAGNVPLTVKGATSQTANLQEWQNSSGTTLSSINDDGYLGIGIAAGTSQKLYVYANQSAMTSAIRAVKTNSDNTNSTSGLFAQNQAINSSGTTSTLYGTYGYAINGATGTGDVTNTIGGYSIARQSSANAATNLIAYKGYILSDASKGLVTTADSYSASSNVGAGSTITNYRGLSVLNPTGSGTITNAYGVYLDDQSFADTLNYAIYTNAGDNMFNAGGDANTDFTVQGDTDADLLFVDAGNDIVQLGKLSINGAFTFPTADGSTDQVLSTNGSGTLSWASVLSDGLSVGGWTHIDHALHSDEYWADDLIIGGNSTASATFQVLASGDITTVNQTVDWTLNDAVDALNFDGNTLSIDALNERVGIGTAAPDAKLQSVSTTEQLRLSYDGSNYSSFTTNSGGNLNIDPSGGAINLYDGASAFDFRVYNGATQAINLRGSGDSWLNGGNVGIGTITPTALLDIAGNASTSGTISFRGPTIPYINILNGEDFGINFSVGGDVGLSTKMKIYGTGYTDFFSGGGNNQLRIGRSATENLDIYTDDQNTIIESVQDENAPGYGNMIFRVDDDGTADGYFAFQNKSVSEFMRITSAGSVGIGDTDPASLFTVGNGDLFQVDSTGSIVSIDGIAHSIVDTSGDLELSSNSTNISLNDNVTFGGTTTLGSGAVEYTWPAAVGSDGQVLSTNTSGVLSWASVLTDGLSVGGWTHIDHALHPDEYWADDLIIGGNSTASAKFQVFADTGNITSEGSLTFGSDTNLYRTAADSLKTDDSLYIGNSKILLAEANAYVYAAALANYSSGNNALVQTSTTGTTISRNIADSSPSLIVQQTNASSTGDILQLKNDTSTAFAISQTGLLTLVNSATIDNTADGTISITEPTIQLIGSTSLDIDVPTIDYSTQTLDVTLNDGVDALNFDSNTLSIDASNNRVGIGTGAPEATLEVSGTGRFSYGSSAPILDIKTTAIITAQAGGASGQDMLRISTWYDGTTPGSGGRIKFTAKNASDAVMAGIRAYSFGGSATSGLAFETGWSGSNQVNMVLDGQGYVGIGTTSPTSLLDIAGNASASGNLALTGTTPKLNILNGDNFSIQTSVGGDTGLSEVFTITGDGSVGIGTTSPYRQLNVYHPTDGVLATFQVGDSGNVGIQLTNTAETWNIDQSSTEDFRIGDSNQVNIFTIYNGAPNDSFAINSSGFTGIGDNSPTSLFTVGNGDLFQVDSTGSIVSIDGVAHSIVDTSGDLELTSNSTNISLNDNVTFAGTTTLGSGAVAYTWPTGDGTADQVLATDSFGQLSWASVLTDGLSVGGWTHIDHALHPDEYWVDDLIIGGNSTASATFQVTAAGDMIVTGTSDLQGAVTNSTGNIDLNDNTDVTGTLSVTSTTDLQGDVSDSLGDFTIADDTIITGTLDVQGNISDSLGNLILDDTLDLGSASTGINITTSGTISDIDGNIALNDSVDITGSLTATVNADFEGTLTSGTANAFVVDASGNVTSGTWTAGVVTEAYGGTGQSSYTVGDLLYADGAASLAKLADVATGNVLLSGGVGVAPAWGQVVLGTHTTGNYVSSLTGTANQITASGSTGDITLSVPSDFRAPGTVNAVNGIFTGATAGTERITAAGNLTNIGTTGLNGVTYTWPGADGSADQVLSTDSGGNLSWASVLTDGLSVGGWTHIDHALHPDEYWADDLIIGGNSTASATFQVTAAGDLTVDGSTTLNGAVTLGDATSDDIVFTGYVASNILPKTDDTYDLGSNSLRWQDLYLGPQTLHIGTSTSDEGTIGYTTGTNVLGITNNYGDTDFSSSSDGFNFTLGGAAGDDFIVDTTTLVVESDNNRVGIGTAAPNSTLEVAGNASLQTNSLLFGTSGSEDVNLYRSGANTLVTDDIFNAVTQLQTGGTFEALRNFSVPQRFYISTANDANVPVLYIGSSGQITMNSQGSEPIRFNYDKGTGGVIIGNGASGEVARFDANGNVGIGDTTPDGLLDIEGAVIGQALLQLNETGDQDIFTASASGTTRMTLTNAGNLGIGTNSPDSPLHIINSNARIKLNDDDETTSYTVIDDASPSQFKISKNTNTGNSFIDLNPLAADGTSEANVRFFRETNTSGSKYLRLYDGDGTSNADIQLGVGSLDTYFETGDFGIGDTTPDHKLDVAGNIGLDASGYINYGDTDGTTGYGFRDNAGNLEFKDSGGSWENFSAGGSSEWTLGSGVLYPNGATSDLAVGGTTLAASIFSIDESTGTFLFGGDQSANPTLTFEATDSDTGDFGFNTNDAFYFTGASVGIGTTNPTSELHISGTSSPRIKLSSTDATDPVLEFDANGKSAYIFQDDALGSLHIRTDTITEHLLLQASGGSGNVGIGNQAPSHKLDIEGYYAGNALMSLNETGGNDILTASASGTTRMTLTNAGNLGIGTNTPDSILEISAVDQSQLLISENSGTDGDTAELLFKSSTGDVNYAKAGIIFEKTGGNGIGDLFIANRTTGDSTTVTKSDSKLTILNSGDIGIGTNSPLSQLHLFRNDTTTSLGQMLIQQSGAGDASIQYSITGVTNWITGADNDDANSLKFSASNILGTSDVLTLTTAGNLNIDTANAYLNFGATDGTTGYGLRDNAGNIEFKDSGGSWTDFGAGGSSLFTDGGTVTYLTATADDLAIGGSTLAASIFSIDESAGIFLFGGDQSANPTLRFEATDSDTGDFGFNTNDAFYFTGANVGIGTNNPGALLHLSSTGNILPLIESTDNNAVQLIFKSDNTNRRIIAKNSSDVAQSQITLGDDGQFTFLGETTGDERMRIASTGNIGIGGIDTTPDHRLDIEGYYAGNALMSLNETGGNDILTASASGTTRFTLANNGDISTDQQTINWTLNDAVDALNFDANTLSIDALNERVGIGTAAPSTTLDVSGTSNFTTANGLDQTSPIFNITNNDTTAGQGFGVLIKAGNNSASDTPFEVQTRAGTNLFEIRSDGNIGIGVNNEVAYPLDVRGGIFTVGSVSRFSTYEATDTITPAIILNGIKNTDPGADFGTGISFTLDGYTSADVSVGEIGAAWEVAQTDDTTTRDSYLSFSTSLNNSVSEKVRINSAGNVGIGSTTPEALLEVQGAEGLDAIIALDADDGDDANDTWFIESEAADNDLSFVQDSAERMKIDTNGYLYAGRFIDLANSNYFLDPAAGDTSLTTAGKAGIGNATPVGMLDVDGDIIGKALAILNETGDQDIFTASASGTTRFTIGNNGSIAQTFSGTTTNAYDLTADSLTTGNGFNLSLDGLTTGNGFYLESTSTALTSGSLANYYWNPGSSTTATGDLFKVNVGANALVTGNIFTIQDNGTDLFSVNQAGITSALPHSFTAAGDVSLAYDQIFTNQTTSKIESYGPFTIEVGESFESNNLDLTTYNSGNVQVNLGSGTTANGAQLLVDADTTDFIAGFTNDGNADTRKGLFIQGCLDTNPTSACNLLEFRDGNGTILGAVEGDGAGGVTTAAAGADYAELFDTDDSTLQKGDLLALDVDGKVIKATSGDRLLGAHSVNPNTLGNWFDGWEKDDSVVPVGLLGQIPIKVSDEFGIIKSGDPITVSPTSPGVGVKAVKADRIIGFAMEDAATSFVRTYIAPTWHDPYISLTRSGDISLAYDIDTDQFQTITASDTLIDKVGTYLQATIATLQAGLINARRIVVDELVVDGQDIATYIASIVQSGLDNGEIISPDSDSDVILGSEAPPESIAAIEENITTNESVIASNSAAISYNDKRITSNTNEIDSLNTKYEILDTDTASLEADVARHSEALAEESTINSSQSARLTRLERLVESQDSVILGSETLALNTNEVTPESGTLPQPTLEGSDIDQLNIDELDISDLQDQVATFSATLSSNSIITQLDTLSDLPIESLNIDFLQVNTAAIAEVAVIADSLMMTHDSLQIIDNQTLFIQPAGGNINLAAGLLTLDSFGNTVTVNGDLKVNGNLIADNASFLKTNTLHLTTDTASISAILAQDNLDIRLATNSALIVKTEFDNPVASINASGSASFNDLALSANSSGTFQISSGTKTAAVRSSSLASSSQVIITLEGDYSPATKYWITKDLLNDRFIIHLDYPVNTDVSGSWIVINRGQ